MISARVTDDGGRFSHRYVLEHSVEGLCLDFTDALHDAPAAGGEADDGGAAGAASPPASVERVELVPGGESIEVTDENKAEFVGLVAEWRLFVSVRAQTEALLKGMHAAVPESVLTQLATLIAPPDLALMLAGEPRIDIADWRRHTAVGGWLQRKARLWRWFWRAVRSFKDEEREALLMFVTGSRRPPVGGFAQLQGFNGGVHKFTLCLGDLPTNSLPRAHACICTIDLPPYATYAVLRRSVYTALSMGCVGFDDAAVADGGGTRDAAE